MELWCLEDEEAKVTMGFMVGFAVLKMAEVKLSYPRETLGSGLGLLRQAAS